MTPTSNLSPGDSAERAIAAAPKVAKPAVTAVVCLTNCLRWMEGFMSRKTLERGPVFNFEAPSFAIAWFGASEAPKICSCIPGYLDAGIDYAFSSDCHSCFVLRS